MKIHKEKLKKEFKKRIYSFTLRLIKLVDSLKKDTSSQVIGKQLLRSATSVGANYVEAQAASSKKDFANFFHHALKSANESKFWLALLKDAGKAEKREVEELLREITEISNIFGASLLKIKGKK